MLNPDIIGIGECGLLKGLSIDDRPDYEEKIIEVCSKIQKTFKYYLDEGLKEFPSIRFWIGNGFDGFGLVREKGKRGHKGNRVLFPSNFTSGKDSIEINGLVWMGEFDFMKQQIKEKIESGFRLYQT